MFTAKELIDEVGEGLETACVDRQKILRWLNKALLSVASEAGIYLPELLVEGRSLSSFAGRNYTFLPQDYHKQVTSVMADNMPVRVYDSLANLKLAFNGLRDDAGNMCGVATQGNKIFYQPVPATQQVMVIGYYRKPEQLEDSDNSYPEGATGSYSFYECLTSYALWKLYGKIENGVEGPMANTAYYKNDFYENLETLRDFCTRDTGPDNTEPASEPIQLFND